MFEYNRVILNNLSSFEKIFQSVIIFSYFKVNPHETVYDITIVRLKLKRFINKQKCLFKVYTSVSITITEIIKGICMFWINLHYLLQILHHFIVSICFVQYNSKIKV